MPIITRVGLFLSGVVVAINLTRLIEVDRNYEAAWWKVGAAGAIAVFCLVLSMGKRKAR